MRVTPLAFATGVAAWAAAVVAAVLVLPRRQAVWVSALVTFGHTVGASSWLIFRMRAGWVLAVPLLFGAGCLGRLCWREGRGGGRPD